jgi:hypothetical protein
MHDIYCFSLSIASFLKIELERKIIIYYFTPPYTKAANRQAWSMAWRASNSKAL